MNAKVRSLAIVLVLVLLLVGNVQDGNLATASAAPPPPNAPSLTLTLHEAALDDGPHAPLQSNAIFPGYILGIEGTWESRNLREEDLTFTARFIYPSPEVAFFEDDTFN